MRLLQELGSIGDADFVKKLDKELAEGQEAVGERETKEAIEKLKQFVKKLDKAATEAKEERKGKKEKEERREEKERERFVTAEALNLLRSDAQTLIADLGSQLKKD